MKVRRYKCPKCNASSDTLFFEVVEKFYGYVDTDGQEERNEGIPDRHGIRHYCPACDRQMEVEDINRLIVEEEM